jgi:hypothetical protein
MFIKIINYKAMEAISRMPEAAVCIYQIGAISSL